MVCCVFVAYCRNEEAKHKNADVQMSAMSAPTKPGDFAAIRDRKSESMLRKATLLAAQKKEIQEQVVHVVQMEALQVESKHLELHEHAEMSDELASWI